MMRPRKSGVVEKIATMQAVEEIIMLPISNLKYPTHPVSLPRLTRESIEAAARVARMMPIAPEENPFSFPKTGKKTTSTSTVELTARLAYMATIMPGLVSNLRSEALSREFFAVTSNVGRNDSTNRQRYRKQRLMRQLQ